MRDLLKKCDMMFIQEHCLFESLFDKFYELGDINFHAVSAMNEKEYIAGRPHGGCAIIWNKNLDHEITPVQSANNRICAVKLNFREAFSVLCLNMYLPCDTRRRDESFDTLQECIIEILRIINNTEHEYVILGGDMNCDFSRSTIHVNSVNALLTELDLKCGIYHESSDVDYTFQSKGSNASSLIDHFATSNPVFHSLVSYTKYCSIDNFSDHEAVTCKFNLNVELLQNSEKHFNAKSAWYKASAEDLSQYRDCLNNEINGIDIPWSAIHCNDTSCTEHKEDITNFHADIVACCIIATTHAIPKTKPPGKRCPIPGWNKHVKHKRNKAQFWFNLWKTCDRPREGHVADIMRHTKQEFHKAIRVCKRNADNIKAQHMGEAPAQNRTFGKK